TVPALACLSWAGLWRFGRKTPFPCGGPAGGPAVLESGHCGAWEESLAGGESLPLRRRSVT
ncbi:MAG TPA: hypothetical protein VJA21_26955, partial [Verrucomicrobiae bacterium]